MNEETKEAAPFARPVGLLRVRVYLKGEGNDELREEHLRIVQAIGQLLSTLGYDDSLVQTGRAYEYGGLLEAGAEERLSSSPFD